MTRRVAVGLGLSSKARVEEVARLIGDALLDADIDGQHVDVVATIDTRADHRALTGLRWPVMTYSRSELDALEPGIVPDDPPRVAEPASLLAAGEGAVLVVDKRRSKHATVAIAVADRASVADRALTGGGFQRSADAVAPLDEVSRAAAIERHLQLTKPAGSLGRLEALGAHLAAISGEVPPPPPRPAAVAVFAADHGVHAQGVSPWPQEVTAQMVMNLSSGGAAVNVFARQHGIAVTVVDVGVATPLPPLQGVRRARVADGSADLSAGPAMTRDQAMEALDIGATVAAELVSGGMRCLLTGDMGIANTTPSAALIAAFTGRPAAEVTGRGTGIDDPTLARKAEIVAEAVGRADPTDGLGTLAALGGFEIAALAGYIVGGAAARVPVIVDGVIAGAALLTASRLVPGCEAYAIAGHRSTEPGASAVLETLGIHPLVDLDLRLGEGTGACLAFPFVESAVRIMSEMATFDSAGVTEKAGVTETAGGVERPVVDEPDGTD